MKQICMDCYTLEEFLKELIPLLQPLLSKQSIEVKSNDVLTRKQAAEKLNITLSTLNTWTKQQRITAYRQGSRIYYKEEELLASLKEVNHKHYKKVSIKN